MQMKMDDIKDWNDDDNVFGSIGNIATPPSKARERAKFGLAASSGNDAFAPSTSRRNSQASDYPRRNLPAPPMQASKPKTSSSRDISTATSALGKPTAASLQSSSYSGESSQETTMSTRKTQTITPGLSLSTNNRPSTSTPIDVIRSFHAPEKRSESIEQIRKSGSYREAHTDSLATLSKASNQSKMRNTSSRQSPPDATEMKRKLETQTRVRQNELEMTKKSSSETAYSFQPNTLSEGVQKRVQVSQKTYGGNNASRSLRSNIAPTSMRRDVSDEAKEFLTSNNGQPRKQGQTVKKVKVPEVMDLVSDEDENQDQSNAMPNPSENMEDNMTVAEYLEYSRILKQLMQPFDSKIMPPSELENRPTWTTVAVDGKTVEASPHIPLLHVYFGLLRFQPCNYKLATRVIASGPYEGILLSLNKEDSIHAERFPFNTIDRIVCFNKDTASNYYILHVNPNKAKFEYIITIDRVFEPNAKKNSSTKLIVLEMDSFQGEIFERYLSQRHKHLVRISNFFDKDHAFQELIHHTTDEQFDKAMENFLQRKSRTERRRHKTTGNHAQHDPKDSLIYLIYPPEPEAIDAVTIHHGDLKRLEDGVYFNDSLIDLTVKHRLAYSLKLYSVCDDIALSQRKAYAFSCLFYAKLTEGRGGKAAHDLVARWTKNVNIFEQDFIFFPINQGHHWSLVVIVRPALLLLEETAEEDDGSKEDAKEQVAEEDGEERLVAKKRKVAEELVEDDKREQLRRKKRSSAFDTTSNSDEMDEDSNSKRRRSSRLSSTKKVDIVTEETISPDKRKSTDNSNHSRKADANQTDKAIEITPPTLSKKVKKHNHACFLHLDSLNLHPTQSIYTTITSYLFFELEAIQNRTKTAAATTSAAGSSGEKTESGSDNEATNTATGKSADHKKSSPTHSTSSQSSSSSSKQKSKKVLEEKKTVELSSAESLKRFREKLEKVKCKVPRQLNGYDCGVFVIRFVRMILDLWPSSTKEDMTSCFKETFEQEFSQEDIHQERNKIRELLEELRVEYRKFRPELEAKSTSNAEKGTEAEAEDSKAMSEGLEDGRLHPSEAIFNEAKEESDAIEASRNKRTPSFDINNMESIIQVEAPSSSEDEYPQKQNLSSPAKHSNRRLECVPTPTTTSNVRDAQYYQPDDDIKSLNSEEDSDEEERPILDSQSTIDESSSEHIQQDNLSLKSTDRFPSSSFSDVEDDQSKLEPLTINKRKSNWAIEFEKQPPPSVRVSKPSIPPSPSNYASKILQSNLQK